MQDVCPGPAVNKQHPSDGQSTTLAQESQGGGPTATGVERWSTPPMGSGRVWQMNMRTGTAFG